MKVEHIVEVEMSEIIESAIDHPDHHDHHDHHHGW